MSNDNNIWVPAKVLVGNTYTKLEVRGYTIGELLTLSKINQNKTIAEMDIDQLGQYISQIFRTEDNYTFRDLYLIDVQINLLYALLLTDPGYRMGYTLTCGHTKKDGTPCGHVYDYEFFANKISANTEGLIPDIEIHGYTFTPVKIGDYLDHLKHIQELGKDYDRTQRTKSILANLLEVPQMSYKDKLELIDKEVPATVLFEILNNEIVQNMDIQFNDIENTCPECGGINLLEPEHDLKALLPSLQL